MAPLPWYGATPDRHMAIATAMWRLTTAMAGLPQIGGELAPNGANWRQLAIANFVQPPNFGGDWRYRQLAFDTYDEKGDSYRQLAPIGANRNLWRQNFWRQYVWRQLAPNWRQCIWRSPMYLAIANVFGANVFGANVFGANLPPMYLVSRL